MVEEVVFEPQNDFFVFFALCNYRIAFAKVMRKTDRVSVPGAAQILRSNRARFFKRRAGGYGAFVQNISPREMCSEQSAFAPCVCNRIPVCNVQLGRFGYG